MSDSGNSFLKELSERRRFGMKPGLDTIRGICAALGDPQKRLRNVIHVAGTNGKGAVCAILDAALGNWRIGEWTNERKAKVARYTSPHLVRINERFFLDGAPIADEVLECASQKVDSSIRQFDNSLISSVTFFEALTAVAFEVFAETDPDWTVLETGLGGRLDATNICEPKLCVITRIGLDHCDWLGDTVEKIAAEKAGIIKPGVPVVLARNEPSVIDVVRRTAAEKSAPFFYAPDLASDSDIPADFPLLGSFNRENCLTALAALKVLEKISLLNFSLFTSHFSLSHVVWPGRFQRIGTCLVDGAHNPPAARALADALSSLSTSTSSLHLSPSTSSLHLICGFCGDKDALEVLKILKPFVSDGIAVRTNNPRSLSAEATAALMREAGIPATTCESLRGAIALTVSLSNHFPREVTRGTESPTTLICGSLFLAGEAIVELNAYPWGSPRFDPSELLKS